jgi:ribosomal protein S18 acetylase RimI-like enzyme
MLSNSVAEYEIRSTAISDMELIFDLFEQSIIYQQKKGYPVWRNYDKDAIKNDIENKNQYKVVIASKPALVFSVCYDDVLIWREHEKGDAIYLHRIVVNPEFKGQKLFGAIVDWSVNHCRQKSLKKVRIDTWANNPTIIDYYKSFGFRFIENYTTPDNPELPAHDRNLSLALLEYNV